MATHQVPVTTSYAELLQENADLHLQLAAAVQQVQEQQIVIDQLIRMGHSKADAGSIVMRELDLVGALPPRATPQTVLNFRRDLYGYGEHAIEVYKSAKEVIDQAPESQRRQVAFGLISTAMKLKNPPS